MRMGCKEKVVFWFWKLEIWIPSFYKDWFLFYLNWFNLFWGLKRKTGESRHYMGYFLFKALNNLSIIGFRKHTPTHEWGDLSEVDNTGCSLTGGLGETEETILFTLETTGHFASWSEALAWTLTSLCRWVPSAWKKPPAYWQQGRPETAGRLSRWKLSLLIQVGFHLHRLWLKTPEKERHRKWVQSSGFWGFISECERLFVEGEDVYKHLPSLGLVSLLEPAWLRF